MYLLAFKNFIRSRSVIIALTLYFLAGCISILIGRQFLQKQESAIAAVTRFQKEHIERNVIYNKDEFGLLMYYLKFAYINQPEPIAALAIGQQDINSTIQFLTIRGLEAQRYDTDLYNPYNLLTGNFDLSFVIIFLFPLLIIAVCFNGLSREKEGGTWPLVKVQSGMPLHFILQKLSIRLFTVLALLLLLLAMAKIIIPIPFDEKLMAYSLTSILYVLVWFAICFAIIALKKNSSLNALLLLSIWVLLCLLIPAAVNNYITAKYPVKEAYSTFIKQRDGYHTKWDKNKDSTMQLFFAHYPQYKNLVWTQPGFDYFWYYAMQQLGDDESAGETRAMRQKLRQREQLSSKTGLVFPAMHAQLQFTLIAGTGLQQHLQYLDSTARFHENLRLHFYPKIFNNSPVETEEWKNRVPEYFKLSNKVQWTTIILPPVIFIAMLYLIGLILFKRKISIS